MEDFLKNVTIFDHPLIKHKVSHLRDVNTGSKEFCELVEELAMLMGYEALKDLPLKEIEVQAPLQKVKTEVIAEDFTIVPILRAGLGMVDGMLTMIPAAKVGHIGLYRDPVTVQPVEYYCKMPADAAERDIFVVDPMLATGGSAIAAIDMLNKRGIKKIRFLCLIAAPEGLAALQKAHPEVDIYVGALDEELNEHGYIVPGLGDAGDRIFGTK